MGHVAALVHRTIHSRIMAGRASFTRLNGVEMLPRSREALVRTDEKTGAVIDLHRKYDKKRQRLVLVFSACRKAELLWQGGVLLALRDMGLLRECGAILGVGFGNLIPALLLSALDHVEKAFPNPSLAEVSPNEARQWRWERLVGPTYQPDLLRRLVLEPLRVFATLDHDAIDRFGIFRQTFLCCLGFGEKLQRDVATSLQPSPAFPTRAPCTHSIVGRTPCLALVAQSPSLKRTVIVTQEAEIRPSSGEATPQLMARPERGSPLPDLLAATLLGAEEEPLEVRWGPRSVQSKDVPLLRLHSVEFHDPLGLLAAESVMSYFRLSQNVGVEEKKKKKEEEKGDHRVLLLVDGYSDSGMDIHGTGPSQEHLASAYKHLDSAPDRENMQVRARFQGIPLRLYGTDLDTFEPPVRDVLLGQKKADRGWAPTSKARTMIGLGYAQAMHTWGRAIRNQTYDHAFPAWKEYLQNA